MRARDINYSLDKKTYEILSMCNNHRIVSIETLAKKLNVTTRSIRTYTKQINNEFGESIVLLNYLKGKGYELQVKDSKRFKNILEQSTGKEPDLNVKEDRIKFIIHSLLELEGFFTLEAMAEVMLISRNTLVNDFKVIKQILKDYRLTLFQKKAKGMKLEGSEIDKRLLQLNYLPQNLVAIIKDFNFSSQKIKCLEEKIIKILKQKNITITDAIIKNLIKHILILLRRIQCNNIIIDYDNRFDLLKSYSGYYEISKQITEVIQDIFEIKLEKFETLYLIIPLVSSNAPADYCVLNEESGDSELLLKEILNAIKLECGVSFENAKLEVGLRMHLNFALNRLLFNIYYKNAMIDDIKRDYKLALKFAYIAADVIEKKYSLKVSEDEVGYIAIHFQTYLEEQRNKLKEIKSVALVSGNGWGTVKLLETKIRRIIGDQVTIRTLSRMDSKWIETESYDLIITTKELPPLSKNTKIIKIDPVFDEDQLREKLNIVPYLKNQASNYENQIYPILNYLINKKLFISLNKKTLSDNLNKMLEQLKVQGCIDSKFIERIKDCGRHSFSAFENGNLMPHAINESSEDLSIAIAVLENPIIVKGKEIKLIILMIFPKEHDDSELLMKAYEEILRVAHDKAIIDQISQCKTFTDFQKIFI